MGDGGPIVADTLHGASLNMTSPQSDLAPAILALFKKVLLKDRSYIERIKKHYRLFRDRIDAKAGNPEAGAKRIRKEAGIKRVRVRS